MQQLERMVHHVTAEQRLVAAGTQQDRLMIDAMAGRGRYAKPSTGLPPEGPMNEAWPASITGSTLSANMS